MKRLIVTVVAAALVSLGSVGVAAAQTDGTTSPSTQPAPSAGRHGHGHHGAGLLHIAAQTLGVNPRDLLGALCGGKTIGQLASDHGKSSQDVINALVQAADQRIDEAVTAGRLDAAKAAERKSRVEARVTRLVNDLHVSSARCERRHGGGATTPTSTG